MTSPIWMPYAGPKLWKASLIGSDSVQIQGGRCTVIVPNNRIITTGERLLFPQVVRRIFCQAGYELYDVTYASRRTQQKQGRQMGVLNNRARRDRVPLSDISEVLTFITPHTPKN